MKSILLKSILYFSLFFLVFSKAFSGGISSELINTTFMTVDERAEILSLPEYDENTARYYLEHHYDSPKNLFRIHYNLTGEHAVDPTDNNNNGIPDYVDSIAFYADYCYQIEIVELGFRKPLSDDTLNGNDNYDIFLFDLGNPAQGHNYEYGHTKPDADYVDNTGPRPRYSSMIVMDNDYSPTDSAWVEIDPGEYVKYPSWRFETGATMAKAIIAHEYCHAIQMTYGYSVPLLLYELTSTWMEWHIFPEVTDYHQHVNGLMRNPDLYPFGKGLSDAGYKWMIFGEYLDKEQGYEVIRRMWEIFAEDINIYKALDMALQEVGSDLVSEWCTFIPWTYYTGYRTELGYLDDADEFIEMVPKQTRIFSKPSTTIIGSLERFEVNLLRFIFPTEEENSVDDTLDVLISSTDLPATINGQPGVRDFSITCIDEYQEGFTQFSENGYYFKVEGELDYLCYHHYASGGYTLVDCDYVFPNPFKYKIHAEIDFPAPPASKVREEVTLTIYTASMKEIYHGTKTVSGRQTTEYNCKVVNWNDIPSDISSGIYIYRIEQEGYEKIGKFAVIR
jgi:uncharacterized protein DUF6055